MTINNEVPKEIKMKKINEKKDNSRSKGLFADCKEYQSLEKQSNKSKADEDRMKQLYKQIKTQLLVIYAVSKY